MAYNFSGLEILVILSSIALILLTRTLLLSWCGFSTPYTR